MGHEPLVFSIASAPAGSRLRPISSASISESQLLKCLLWECMVFSSF
jgi:hypothetical protein